MIRETDLRFKNLEKKIGIFILAALCGVVLIIVLVGIQRDLFTKKYTLKFTVDRGTGFTKGMPVKLSGFRIGRISSMSLDDHAMVDVFIEIDRKYKKWIRKDSTVKMVKEGLVGDNIVEIAVGSSDKAELKEGEAIRYVKTKALDEVVDEIAEKVKPVLSEVRDIISYVNDPNGDLKKTIKNLEQLTRNLEQTRGRADTLILSTNRNLDLVTNRTVSLLDLTSRKIDSLDLARLNTSLEKLPALMAKTDATMTNLAAISEETRKLSEQAFPQIPGLLYRTDELLFSADRLINNLGNSWLLGGTAGQPPVDRGVRAGDSHE
jgi:phospholipid/cholesterol/gamma-HCH transport system substrate-binding protein